MLGLAHNQMQSNRIKDGENETRVELHWFSPLWLPVVQVVEVRSFLHLPSPAVFRLARPDLLRAQYRLISYNTRNRFDLNSNK